MCNADTVVPMKTVYGRIVPGLTRNAVSNRVPKIGAKTIALSDAHIAVLKKLQLPITARSHYLTVSDFIKVCQYYGRTPPRNLANFVYITSRHNPAEILKSFNTQSPVFPAPSMGAPQGGGVGANMSMAAHTQDARSGLLPDPMSAEDQAPGYPTLAMGHSWHHSVSEESLSDLLSPTVSEGDNALRYMYHILLYMYLDDASVCIFFLFSFVFFLLSLSSWSAHSHSSSWAWSTNSHSQRLVPVLPKWWPADDTPSGTPECYDDNPQSARYPSWVCHQVQLYIMYIVASLGKPHAGQIAFPTCICLCMYRTSFCKCLCVLIRWTASIFQCVI